MLTLILTAALSASSLAFVGQDAPATQTAPAAQDESIIVKGKQRARDKRVCKRAVATGSIMSKSTCKTAGEWEIERERSLAQLDQLRQRKMMEDEARRQKFDQ